MTNIIFHSNNTSEYGTPSFVVNLSKLVLGTIDLDPASTDFFNRSIGAKRIFTKENSAFDNDWTEETAITVFLNPPSGKLNNKSLPKLFWRELIRYREKGLINHAIFLAYSIEQLQTTQGEKEQSILDFPFIVPNKRLKFLSSDGVTQKNPSHSNAIVYVPGIIDKTKSFAYSFGCVGKCAIPYGWWGN